jgi:hypothetical protein
MPHPHPADHGHLRLDTESKHEAPGAFNLKGPSAMVKLQRWLDHVFGQYDSLGDDHTFNDEEPSPSRKRRDGYTPNHLLLQTVTNDDSGNRQNDREPKPESEM